MFARLERVEDVLIYTTVNAQIIIGFFFILISNNPLKFSNAEIHFNNIITNALWYVLEEEKANE